MNVSRAHLFGLRAGWLHQPAAFTARRSGGNHPPAWSAESPPFRQAFRPLQRPPNYQLVADALAARFAFQRNRRSVAAYARRHFPLLVSAAAPALQPRRRWQRARLGERWQHDSSLHPWGPAEDKQTLLLPVDDPSRKLLGAPFVPTDTPGNHCQHFRRLFTGHGLPRARDTAGRAWFGPGSTTDGRDPRSACQRALTALGVPPRVAPSPPAKGKIERRFGPFPNRLVALLAYEKITAYAPAQARLARERARQNRTVCRPPGLSPAAACAQAQAEGRTVGGDCPDPSLRALPLALPLCRRVNADHPIDFLGRRWPSSATARKTVTIMHHPPSQFGVVSQPPQPPQNRRSDMRGKFSL